MTDWSALEHAYGNAADIPQLLCRLSPDPDASVWEELWSRLCHQGTVYPASFAALPALAEAAGRWKPAERVQPMALAASILASKDRCPKHLAGSLDWLVPRFQQLCRESLAQKRIPKGDFVYLLQAAHSFDGDRFWGEELDHLISGEFPGQCPHCGVNLYLVIGEHGFFTTAEEWVQRAGGKSGKIAVRPGITVSAIEPNSVVLPQVAQWMYEHAQAAQQVEVADWIRHLFGRSICPSCGRSFDVQDAIAGD